MRLYVGNISFQMSEDELRDLFSNYGEVQDAVIVTDRETGRSRGFGFVTMAEQSGGESAIEGVAGTEVQGRTLNVNEARPRTENGGGGGGGGGYRRNR